MRGDSFKVADQLRRRMSNYFLAAVICSALVYAIVRLYQYQVVALPL